MTWHRGNLLGFDTETSGVSVDADRIVTASLVHIRPGQPVEPAAHLIAVDVDIPEAAQAVHGISTEHARTHGRPAPTVLDEVAAELAAAMRAGTPVVGMNVAFDLTLLDRECRRHQVPTLGERLHGLVRPVVDVRVLDKRVDQFRRGGRKLSDLCATYRVRIDQAHDATWDALAAARVAWRIAETYPEVVGIDLDDLHDEQIQWHADQQRSFAAYRERVGSPIADLSLDWPVIPLVAAACCPERKEGKS